MGVAVFWVFRGVGYFHYTSTSPAMAGGVTDRLWEVTDLVALWESDERRRAERAAQMKRAVEIASGIGVFVTSVVNSMAVLRMTLFYQQSSQKVPLISLVSLSVTGLAVLLSFLGAFILLSWAHKSK